MKIVVGRVITENMFLSDLCGREALGNSRRKVSTFLSDLCGREAKISLPP